MAKFAFNLRRTHKIIGLVAGLLLLSWTASGLFFSLFPITEIRGEHLRREAAFAPLIGAGFNTERLDELFTRDALMPQSVTLRPFLDGPIYEVKTSTGYAAFDAQSGDRITPLGEDMARRLALANWAGDGDIIAAELVEYPPREAGSASPLWRIQFKGADSATFWVDPDRAVVKSVRTTKWRIFDVLWRFHILDITGDDKIDSWWMKLAAFLGLTMVLSGLALTIDRALKGRLLR